MNDVKDECNIEKLVSVIVPAYNCQNFIEATLNSIINQTYSNLEVIVIDDCSTDKTGEITKEYANIHNIVKYYKLDTNLGAAGARNKGVEIANGKYIAFLDSDDVWHLDKVSKQVSFMEMNNYTFTCTNYNKIDENGNELSVEIKLPLKNNYNDVLKNCPGNSTVMYNAEKLGKFTIPNIRKRNDYVMWLKVIKKAKYLYCMDEVLASHRIRLGSISSNKFDLVRYHWKVYRDIEKLSVIKSINLINYWIIKTILRTVKIKKL